MHYRLHAEPHACALSPSSVSWHFSAIRKVPVGLAFHWPLVTVAERLYEVQMSNATCGPIVGPCYLFVIVDSDAILQMGRNKSQSVDITLQ